MRVIRVETLYRFGSCGTNKAQRSHRHMLWMIAGLRFLHLTCAHLLSRGYCYSTLTRLVASSH